MPLYRVRVKVPVVYIAEIWADDADAAVSEAIEQAVLPHIDEGWEEDGDAEVDGEPERIAEDDEDPDGDRD